MGVIDGAHGYLSPESQMRVPVYTKKQFTDDYKYICDVLDVPLCDSNGIKKLIFELIEIKLNSGERALLDELNKIQRQRYGRH